VVHTKSAIIAIWLGKSFLRLLIYSQVASLSRPSSLRKRSAIQGDGVWNLHSNKVFESFSFLNMFKLMVLITGRNQESVWLEDASSATQKCMVAEVNSHNVSINVISMIKCYACFYASSLLCNCSLCLWTMVRSCRLRVNMFAPILRSHIFIVCCKPSNTFKEQFSCTIEGWCIKLHMLMNYLYFGT
jgi:hypothetical protein